MSATHSEIVKRQKSFFVRYLKLKKNTALLANSFEANALFTVNVKLKYGFEVGRARTDLWLSWSLLGHITRYLQLDLSQAP